MSLNVSYRDIQRQEFRTSTFGGYKREEVSEFLSELSDKWAELQKENREMEAQLTASQHELDKYREIEKTLVRSLTQTQEANKVTIQQAQKQADVMILEGKMRADALIRDAQVRAKTIVQEAKHLADVTLHDMKRDINRMREEYRDIEVHKEEVVSELKHFLNDALTKINRIASRPKHFSYEEEMRQADAQMQRNQEFLQRQLDGMEDVSDSSSYSGMESLHQTPDAPKKQDTKPHTTEGELPEDAGASFFDNLPLE